MNIHANIAETIGKTPLVRLSRIEEAYTVPACLLAKLERMNPSGSVKDRASLFMLDDAEHRGLLQKGGVIVEPTSGNTGIGLAMLAAARGYRLILTMPDTMSQERRALLKAYGAELVLTEGTKGMHGAIEKARQIAEETPGSFMPGQFDNPANAEAHRAMTGPEIWADTDGTIDIFIAGVGTGGTITGTGAYLKERKPNLRLVAVEPLESPVLSQGTAGPHRIQGIGAGFVPSVLNLAILDEIVTISGDDAMAMGRVLAQREGILSGISSGAAVCAAVALGKRPEYANHTIVVVLPDTGERYLSTAMFDAI